MLGQRRADQNDRVNQAPPHTGRLERERERDRENNNEGGGMWKKAKGVVSPFDGEQKDEETHGSIRAL